MHHVIVERWSRRESALHARDARVKLAATVAFLVIVATTNRPSVLAYLGYLGILLLAAFISKLPLTALLGRAALVLPFSVVFALVSWLGGDLDRAGTLVARSYLSALTVLLLVGSTPLPQLLRALEWFRVPHLLVLISQFLYRYLFVLAEQAQHMRLAAASRTGPSAGGRARSIHFRAAAGALSVLFARSYQRAEGIHQAMLARGFSGSFPIVGPSPARAMDAIFLAIAVALPVAVRAAAWR